MKYDSILKISAATLLLAVSCSREPRVYDADYVGVKNRDLVVEAVAGQAEVQLWASGKVRVHQLSGAEWAEGSASSLSGDGSFGVDYADNEGGPRLAMFEFRLDGSSWKDTLFVKQKGVTGETFVPSSTGIVVYNGLGSISVPLESNLDPSRVSYSIRYDNEGEEWVESVTIEDDAIVLTTADNTGDDTRTATLILSYISGWGETVVHTIVLTQATADNMLGKVLDFSELWAMGSADGEKILDKYILTGYIVSDPSTGNLADNPRITSTSIDYLPTQKAAYLEGLDGSHGVMLVTPSVSDNVFEPFTRVQLVLKDATIVSYDNPRRVVLEDVRASMLLASDRVEADAIPVKNKHISDLTDDDIYTFVTLTDVEFPVRKGGLTPVNEGYTPLSGSHRISKFPVLLRCKDGASMYVLTNTTCPYRRDGTRPGDGSGSLSGIIVHELYRPFNEDVNVPEEERGNIGRYQIRHQSKEDFKFAQDFSSSFSGLIAEWRYMTDGTTTGNKMPATKGEGLLTHTRPMETPYSLFHVNMYNFQEFTYLGPCGSLTNNMQTGNVNGIGIWLDSGEDYSAGDTSINADGKGGGTSKRGYAWASDYWWDSEGDSPWAWLAQFSTSGIQTDRLSLQLSLFNMSQSALTPLNWKVEYSLDNVEWTKVQSFTVPDLVLWNLTAEWQSGGAKAIDVPLPLTLLDKANVYIRICPENNIASSTTEYGTKTITYASGRRNVMNYLAIRYNKQ